MVVVDMDGKVVEGKLKPSSDLPTNLGWTKTRWSFLCPTMAFREENAKKRHCIMPVCGAPKAACMKVGYGLMVHWLTQYPSPVNKPVITPLPAKGPYLADLNESVDKFELKCQTTEKAEKGNGRALIL